MRQRIYILTLLLSLSLVASARSMFDIAARGGVSGLIYTSDYGQMVPRENIGIDLCYNYISVYHVGLRAGIGFDYSESMFRARDFSDSYTAVDVERDVMKVDYTMGSWQETHKQVYASALVQFAMDFYGWRLFVGPRLMIPVSMQYSESAQRADIHVSYPRYSSVVDNEIMNTGIKDQPLQSGKMSNKPAVWGLAAIETGYAIPIAKNQTLYVGAYANIAMNSSRTTSGYNISALQLSDTKDGLPLERLLSQATEANHHSDGRPVITEMRYWDAGVKLAWQIYWGNKRKHYNRKCNCLEEDY